mmetsp:Transcript_174355/g.553457  ORF Transcript_174355/g.553457 Transcript_174355/m.553457 type:complete len:125 (-) Transcript_174355:185-559(-)
MQHSDACEKPLGGSALGTGGVFDACEKSVSAAGFVVSVASDSSKTSSHAMQQSDACEKMNLESAPCVCSSSSSESETTSHSMQHSEACEIPLVGSALGSGGLYDACLEKKHVFSCPLWCFKCSI